MQESTASFKATAYPNPFAAAFKLELTGASQDEVSVKVYDMLGKLVAREAFAAAEITSRQMGANLPSGVYNVVVSQGESLRTLRVIKR